MTFTVFTSRSKKRIRSILFFIFFGFLSINLISCKGGSGGSEENVINANVVANIKALDSIYISDTYSNAVASQIYESLYNYHYLKRPLELQPRLAEALPSVSKDGLTYTIKIKKGIKFQDSEVFPKGKGRELVANDFIYAWKRLADPQNKSDGFWIFDGKIKGLDKWRDNLSNNKGKFEDPIGGLRAVDDHTLQIKLEKPYFQLLYVLAMTYSAPTAKEAVDKYGKEYLNHPVGTGPYKLEKWVRGSKLTLVKNENWAGETYPTEGEEQDKSNGLLEDAGKKLPFADKIVFHVIIEDQPLWLNFMKGNIDMLGIPKDNFDSSVKNGELTADMRDKGIRLQITSEPDVTYIAFNMEDPVLGKNENLRKALSLAYHSRAVIKKFYNDRAVSANSPIPPDIEGYDADFKNPYKTHDVEKAKEYLKKAGFPGGKGLPAFEYITTSSATARQMSEQFKESMAQIGVNIKIATSSWPQFLEKIKNKKAQMFGMAWLADYPDAENFLQLLYGKNISPGPNGSNFKNKEFDKLYEKASLLPPGAEREKLYKEMRDIVVEKAPWIPGAHRLGFYTYQGWLHNFKRHSIISDYFKYLRVDLKEKQELKKKL